MGGYLADHTAEAIDRSIGRDSAIVVPVGAIEQHGRHLPLSTDFVIADETARAVAEALGNDPVWFLPTLPFSKSDEHAWSAGTMWLSVSTMLAVVDDIARSASQAGAGRLVFLNGHGGNTTLLNVACRDIRRTHGLLTFLTHPLAPPAYSSGPSADNAELGMGIHGGLDETAIMLHLRPDLVDLDLAEPNVPAWLRENQHVRFGGSVQFGWLSNDFGPSGVIGDPTGATAEYGAELFAHSVSTIIDQLREILAFDFVDRDPDQSV
ncbi:MAG: creatininase family protein [Ilumatobacteraceae bacterium]|nr:creatininase family protein [Ilumatobacteraceae bacterium]